MVNKKLSNSLVWLSVNILFSDIASVDTHVFVAFYLAGEELLL